MKIKIFLPILLFTISTIGIAQKNSTPKNILFIAVDDLKPMLNVYGENQMHTPNFDRLAEMGVIFENAHVQQAVCGPSRASIMTGISTRIIIDARIFNYTGLRNYCNW